VERVGRKADSARGENRRERRSNGYHPTMSSICDYVGGRRGAGYQYPFGDPARLFHLSAFPRARIGDASRRDEIRAIDSRESRSRTLTRLHRGLARKFAKMSGMYLRNTIYAEIRYRGEDKDAMNSNEDWEYAREIQGAIRDRRQ
jgi:hypothetical protein